MKLLCMFLFLLSFSAHSQQRVVTMTHQATLYFQNSSCTNHSPCYLQVYRAVCPSPTSCPTYVQGSPQWQLVSTVTAATNVTGNNTTWQVLDQDPALQDNTTYAYTATNSFTSDPKNYSSPAPIWSGTTSSGGSSGTPSSPTNGNGNSVN